jgi:hypothetical protein
MMHDNMMMQKGKRTNNSNKVFSWAATAGEVRGVSGPSLHSSGRIRVWVCSLFAFIEIGAMPWGLDILVLSCRHRRSPASPFAGAPWRRLELEVGSDEILHNKGAGSPDRAMWLLLFLF